VPRRRSFWCPPKGALVVRFDLLERELPHALLALVVELAAATKARACPHCGGALHVANYLRKPRGGPWVLTAELTIRHGLCCAREGCRRRTLPPSVRFLGRRVYLAAIVVLGAALRQGPTPWRVKRLKSLLGVDRRTLARWCEWWTMRFVKTATFEALRARLVTPVGARGLPLAVLALPRRLREGEMRSLSEGHRSACAATTA